MPQPERQAPQAKRSGPQNVQRQRSPGRSESSQQAPDGGRQGSAPRALALGRSAPSADARALRRKMGNRAFGQHVVQRQIVGPNQSNITADIKLELVKEENPKVVHAVNFLLTYSETVEVQDYADLKGRIIAGEFDSILPPIPKQEPVSDHTRSVEATKQNTTATEQQDLDTSESLELESGGNESSETIISMIKARVGQHFQLDTKRNQILISLALEQSGKEIEEGAKNPWGIGSVIDNALADTPIFANCHGTAKDFLGVMGSDKVVASEEILKDVPATEKATCDQQGRAIALQAGTRKVASLLTEGKVVHVRYYNHSFLLMIRNGNAEVLQSFANTFTLGASLHADTSLPLGDMKTAIVEMADATYQKRAAAQTKIAGVPMGKESEWTHDVDLAYEIREMKAPEEIMREIDKRLAEGIAALKKTSYL